ncbi:Uncharacterised protein [Yersinia aleksiciae]|uniref:Uncharacterized protein n=1 Tax=Yersinia aleksiciae TaxID=263819 RepID=A0A0T9T9T3_YERAE|nr:Uncharacterised protein [Yersinia aleksiciae]CNK70118.1 Uncharacterised protein [Yersinia aleksiciae]
MLYDQIEIVFISYFLILTADLLKELLFTKNKGGG